MGMFKPTEKLRGWLQWREWDYKKFATELQYSPTMISGVLNGSIEPSMQLMKRIMDITHMDSGDCFTYDRNAKSKEKEQ